MKKALLALTLLLSIAQFAQARTVTAQGNGNWEDASTWAPGAPANGDLVVIPHGMTVSVTSNIQQKTWTMDVRVGGVLNFVGGGAKLWFNSQSVIFVYPAGKINANQNSQVITLGNTVVLNGSNQGITISGPSAAISGGGTSSQSAQSASQPVNSGFLPYSPSALPVQFIAFTATRQAGDVLVQWSTATEENADRYEVEVSTDGRNWTTLGSVRASGNSFNVRQYSYTARNQNGNLQFRVKQVDLDGRYTYTAVRTLKAAADASVKMIATPGRLVLTFGTELKGATVRILNSAGQVLQEQKMNSAFGQVLVPTSQKGLCIVAVFTENEIAATQKVVL
ncbi:MAG: hypothetical protein EOO12_08665 [Chitinophagaceae bacterium]|nr:MAG: hypothetical protein EOO12_08665 [Chitinophagaceae bacterium]